MGILDFLRADRRNPAISARSSLFARVRVAYGSMYPGIVKSAQKGLAFPESPRDLIHERLEQVGERGATSGLHKDLNRHAWDKL